LGIDANEIFVCQTLSVNTLWRADESAITLGFVIVKKNVIWISGFQFIPILTGMSNMHKIRELAMQVLFLWDANANLDLALGFQATQIGDADEVLRMRTLHMAEQTWSQKEAIDAQVERIAPQWPPRRQPGVDRVIIRLAVWEMTHMPTPPKVVIDEAIELAKEFSTEQSPSFVNGVLDAVLHEKQSPEAKASPSATERASPSGAEGASPSAAAETKQP